VSIISQNYVDDSNLIAKRFASIVATYFEGATEVRDGSARVPLENLYRILEMYRFDAYRDEDRKGVLALHVSESRYDRSRNNENWQAGIAAALSQSLEAFYRNVPKETAIAELQESLRSVARGQPLPPDQSRKAHGFFERFGQLV